MYRKLIKPILFAMNIERAHSTVLFLLRMIGKIPGRVFWQKHQLGKVFACDFDIMNKKQK